MTASEVATGDGRLGGFTGRSLTLLGVNLSVAATGFLFWVIAARSFAIGEVGIAGTAVSLAQVLAALSTLGLGIALIRFVAEPGGAGSRLVDPILTIVPLVGLLSGLVYLPLCWVVSPGLVPLIGTPVGAAALVLLVAAYSMGYVITDLLVALRRPDLALVSGVVQNVPRLALPFLLSSLGAHGIMLSLLFPALVSLAVSLFLLLPSALPSWRFRPTLDISKLRPAWRFAATNLVVSGVLLLPLVLLPMWVLHFWGAEEAGAFTIAWSLATLVYTAPSSVSITALADSSAEHSRRAAIMRRALLVASALVAVGLAAVFLFSGEILGLFGAAYRDRAAPTLVILAMAAPAMVIQHYALTAARLRKSASAQLTVASVPVGITLLLLILAAGGWGIGGVALAWTVAQWVGLPIAIAEMLRSHRYRVDRDPVP